MHFTSKAVFLFIICLTVIHSLVISPASAVKVEGAKIMLDVKPGTTYIFPMAVSSKPGDAPSDYAVEVYGFGQSIEGGSYATLTAADDTGRYSARTFVSLPTTIVHIDPGQRKQFNATISVPQNVGEGGRYAVIHIHPAAGSGQSTFATAVIVPVMITVQDTNLIETGNITAIDIGEIAQGKPIRISTTLKNTGNHHYYGVVNQVTITDSAGNTVAAVNSDPIPNAVIPGQSVRFDAHVGTLLGIGTYTVKSEMRLESGAILDSRSTSVTVKETYVPPFQESSMKVGPDTPSTITVPEGTILISLPRGAVLAETTLSLKPYTDNLPQVPAGSIAGSTAFSIDGLTGLLAEDATITVRYSLSDLNAAGGNADNLVLGRYDRIERHWTLLQTAVNKNTMTLTTTTNRFSIWAVIATQESGLANVKDPTQPGVKTTNNMVPEESTKKSPGPDSLIVCGIFAALLIFNNLRK